MLGETNLEVGVRISEIKKSEIEKFILRFDLARRRPISFIRFLFPDYVICDVNAQLENPDFPP